MPEQRVIDLLSDPEPITCAVCRRAASGSGITAGKIGKLYRNLWLCDSHDCTDAARKLFYMSETQLEGHEIMARETAGKRAGAYLEEIGKTDLGDLTKEEWFTFLSRVIIGFGDEMRRRILEQEAPF